MFCQNAAVRYLDYNATAPVCEAAREAWLGALDRWPGNPSSPHRLGSRADRALEDAREELASRLGCSGAEIVWTSGATESNNAAVQHLAATAPVDGEIWLSAIEHPCVRAAAVRWFPGRTRAIPVTRQGIVELDWLEERLRSASVRPVGVAVMAANNETGVIQPWEKVAAWCREAGIPFLCDAAQWFGKLPSAGLAGCTLVSGCAHKFGGAPGVGFLKVGAGFRPLIVGGPQEEGRRAGTENVPGVVACVAALKSREAWLAAHPSPDRSAARDAFEQRLPSEVAGVEVAGVGAARLWNTSAVLLPVTDCRRRWVVRLDRAGFAVSTGSACSSGREKPSHVLAAMGLDGSGERMIRVSGGWETPVETWKELAETLRTVASEGAGVGSEPDRAG